MEIDCGKVVRTLIRHRKWLGRQELGYTEEKLIRSWKMRRLKT